MKIQFNNTDIHCALQNYCNYNKFNLQSNQKTHIHHIQSLNINISHKYDKPTHTNTDVNTNHSSQSNPEKYFSSNKQPSTLQHTQFNKWQHFSFSLLATQTTQYQIDDFTFYRDVGQALTGRYSPAQIENLKISLGQHIFQTQYQQQPSDVYHAIIDKSIVQYINIEHADNYLAQQLHQQSHLIIQSWDSAVSDDQTKLANSYSVCTTWAVIDRQYYLIDLFRAKLNYIQLKQAVFDNYHRYNNNPYIWQELFPSYYADGLPTNTQEKQNTYRNFNNPDKNKDKDRYNSNSDNSTLPIYHQHNQYDNPNHNTHADINNQYYNSSNSNQYHQHNQYNTNQHSTTHTDNTSQYDNPDHPTQNNQSKQYCSNQTDNPKQQNSTLNHQLYIDTYTTSHRPRFGNTSNTHTTSNTNTQSHKLRFGDISNTNTQNYNNPPQHYMQILIEKASSGQQLIQELSNQLPIQAIPPSRNSKAARLQAVKFLFENHKIRFIKWWPEPTTDNNIANITDITNSDKLRFENNNNKITNSNITNANTKTNIANIPNSDKLPTNLAAITNPDIIQVNNQSHTNTPNIDNIYNTNKYHINNQQDQINPHWLFMHQVEQELFSFPNSTHSDIVDSITQFAQYQFNSEHPQPFKPKKPSPIIIDVF